MTHYPVSFCGNDLFCDLTGALYWPAERTLVVADLHLEKGSGLAARGQLLPPYDTRATLDRLDAALRRYSPDIVISLGDSFHDGGALARLDPVEAQRIERMTARHDWIWIAGNHDPEIGNPWHGAVAAEVSIAGLAFRHLSVGGSGEVSGHLHPKASIRTRARKLWRACFTIGTERMILPSFGAYTGGLDVLHPEITAVVGDDFDAIVLGQNRIHRFPSDRLVPLESTRRRALAYG